MDNKLKEVKEELEELLEIENSKVRYHRQLPQGEDNVKNEYFYRGRVALIRHILNTINT